MTELEELYKTLTAQAKRLAADDAANKRDLLSVVTALGIVWDKLRLGKHA